MSDVFSEAKCRLCLVCGRCVRHGCDARLFASLPCDLVTPPMSAWCRIRAFFRVGYCARCPRCGRCCEHDDGLTCGVGG